MFPVTAKYKEYIKKSSSQYDWYGTITFTDNTSISFTGAQIDQNKSKITRQCVTGENLEIGNVFSAELRLGLRDSETWKISDRSYNFQDATITIYFKMLYPDGTNESVPCGIYYVKEAERTYHTVTLIAYDAASKLSAKMTTKFVGDSSPYDAISGICTACEVTLGSTRVQIEALPNGDRNDLKMDIYKKGTSYKEVLGNICTIIGANAVISRTGRLEIIKYGQTNERALTASERYNTSYVDYVGHYMILYVVNKKGEIDEYIHGSTLPYRYLAMNIGKNTLLNSYNQANINSILDELSDYLYNIIYSPCNITMPCDPSIDVADMISVIGGEITGVYTKTMDTVVDENKTYYEMYWDKSGTIWEIIYIPVTPVGTENPLNEGWYEVGTSVICTKIEMPLFGQMKIVSEAGSYELDIDPYATEKEQQEQQNNSDNEDKWDEQDQWNQGQEEEWEQQEQHNDDTDEALDELGGQVESLATKMAVNYIFPYQTNLNPIADGGSAYVMRFKVNVDRDGDTVSFYSTISFTTATTASNNSFGDCNLTVKYYLDNSVTHIAIHTYSDGYAILTLNGCYTGLTAGEHTFDVQFSLAGGSIS